MLGAALCFKFHVVMLNIAEEPKGSYVLETGHLTGLSVNAVTSLTPELFVSPYLLVKQHSWNWGNISSGCCNSGSSYLGIWNAIFDLHHLVK